MPSSPAASPSQPPPVHHHQESQIERHLGSTWAAFAFLTFEAYESGWGTFWTADYSRVFFYNRFTNESRWTPPPIQDEGSDGSTGGT